MCFPSTASRCSTATAKIGMSPRIQNRCRRRRATAARIQAGFTERYLFLYLEVDDPHFIAEPAKVHPEHDRFDRVDLTVQRPDGSRESYFFATSAPGLIEAQTVVKGDDGVDHAADEPRIQAFWLQTARGYHLEARLPLSLRGLAPLDRRRRRRTGPLPQSPLPQSPLPQSPRPRPPIRSAAGGCSWRRAGLDELARHLHARRALAPPWSMPMP